ncbi:HepT-like ribonuclease domain-containing protein [Microbacterium nymphoidis]|uniref:HepT-like ribonuclease domain-containing protein n=1 Tax=Microbacterium nymphoidis TaxID=2898586 RepID=UPI001E613A9F|nr:HepT-like ribonuclease domain-containing protein [Microbacterium nymphoidis]MCD2498501.1 DUF86 domain-containing protein [Microbacterium nymphoidis]
MADPRGSVQPSDGATARHLEHIGAEFRVLATVAAQGREAYDAGDQINRMASFGVLIRLGEQAKRLSPEFILANPAPNYRGMIRQRDFLAHNYEKVDWDVLWTTVSEKAPRAADDHQIVMERFALRAGQGHLGG